MLYRIGVGIAEITDRAVGLPMMGMADKNQITAGVDAPLFARAFLVEDVAIVVADVWSGTRRVKEAVLERLDGFTDATLLLAGTHTHSAPGGISGYTLYDYDFDRGGCDPATVMCVAEGCAAAVRMAQSAATPGIVRVNHGPVAACGTNRSTAAYARNPQAERDRWGADTDRDMLLLAFVALDDHGTEQPLGALSWYPIHPTDLGQKNHQVSGDNKGWASARLEDRMGDGFVAGFANANCGDVSGNVKVPDGVHDHTRMQQHGQAQADVAADLFSSATAALTGPVDARHTRVDLSHVEVAGGRTWPAALGLSFAAGSSEDSVPVPDLGVREGLTVEDLDAADRIKEVAAAIGLAAIFGVHEETAATVQARRGHLPKPIVLMPGRAAPSVLPVQLIRIGGLAVLGIPAELSTMAGRRLRDTLLGVLDVEHVALAAYANEYSQYVTTPEEYGAQNYEGASTLFGPQTLAAYTEVAVSLAAALSTDTAMPEGPPPSPWSSPAQHRYRFRNLSASRVTVHCYHVDDELQLLTLPNGVKHIPVDTEVAFPQREFTPLHVAAVDAVLAVVGSHKLHMRAGELLTIGLDGTPAVGPFAPW